MPRTPAHESTTSVNFRMPNSLLEKMDEISHRNYHDRTTEINNACKHWVEIGGMPSAESQQSSSLSDMEKKIDALTELVTKQLSASYSEIAEMKSKIDILIKELSEEKKQLLRIIEEGMKRS